MPKSTMTGKQIKTELIIEYQKPTEYYLSSHGEWLESVILNHMKIFTFY